jgi:hypothetical protein
MRGDAHIELKHTACSTKPAAKLGVVLANLQLAEDRLPSFLCCFGSGRASAQLPWAAHKTNFVRDAVFYFDVELELHSLVKQRRRWLNGMNAAYLYLLGHASIVWHSERAAASKYVVVLMLACQLFQYLLTLLLPGVYTIMLQVGWVLDFVCPSPLHDGTLADGRRRLVCLRRPWGERRRLARQARVPGAGAAVLCALPLVCLYPSSTSRTSISCWSAECTREVE